jgi:hypothetical protein
MSVPNVFLSRLDPLGKLDTMESITKEVKIMMDPDQAFARHRLVKKQRKRLPSVLACWMWKMLAGKATWIPWPAQSAGVAPPFVRPT